MAVVGALEENCYIVSKNDKVLVIDPGDDVSSIQKLIASREVLGVLLTHHHEDHIGALSMFDNKSIFDSNNLEEKEYIIGDFKFDVIFTPGHTSDSISYYFKDENVLFSGDFIFYETIGRCDLPTGDIEMMKKSISKIKKYPDDMIIYPGHGIPTTLLHEKDNNIYFRKEW